MENNTHSVDIHWTGGMAFEANVSGHVLKMDAAPAVGGSDEGPRPKELMLAALAGCTGMDVVSILKKMRIEPTDFRVEVQAPVTEEHPKQYSAMHIIYTFVGKGLELEKLEKAVLLSQDKYCGVSALYRKAIPVTHEIRIQEEE
jgi:putative redox protein